jgi:Uncharacterized conserved protein
MPAIVVFLGPSLRREEAAAIVPASFRPPVARGDILDAAADGARIIGVIDGVFFQECSVGHREILEVIRQGIRVVGASSMGALRAAELDTLGMEGVGEIYRLYRDGALVSDDEVALVFDPDTFEPLSEPLVNIRCTIDIARSEGVISGKTAEQLFESARALYFPDRTYDQICGNARGLADEGELKRFEEFVSHHPFDQKADDARNALVRIRDLAASMGLL